MGIFDFWKNKTTKKETEAIETEKKQPAINHISRKKKNTYIVTFNTMSDATLFELCKSTPLPIIEINGKEQDISSGFICCIQFPNPCATQMTRSHEIMRTILGDKTSSTIIEYLDKETGAPVVQVYPESWYVFDKYETNYMSRLNHASRRDLKYQLKLREQKINDYIAKQNQR